MTQRLSLMRLAWLLGALACLAAPVGPAAAADEAEPAASDSDRGERPREAQDYTPIPAFPVDRFVVEYREPHPDHPDLATLLPTPIQLSKQAEVYGARREDARSEVLVLGGAPWPEPRYFDRAALADISLQLLALFHDAGLLGVYVAPHPDDVDSEHGRDLRAANDLRMRIQVWTGHVRELRTVSVGTRVGAEWRVNNPVHRRIRELSPIQPPGHGNDDATDLLRRDLLEDYLFRLNRHPGRHVEAALSAIPESEGVALDYQVNEGKPWYVYANASNTGTAATSDWQYRVGYVNNQLTNRDDVLSIDYSNTGLEDMHAVRAAYEAPWFRSERASWWRSSSDDAGWFSRSRMPWWGNDDMRWFGVFDWSRFEADRVDDTDDYVGQEFAGTLGLRYNVWQKRAFFLDLVGSTELRDIAVQNATINSDDADGDGNGHEFFILQGLSLQAERFNLYSDFFADLSWEINLTRTHEADMQRLGRKEVDGDHYQILHWGIGASHFLEPLLFRAAWADPTSERSSTLAHEIAFRARGQYGFDQRLIPQESMTIGGLYSVRGYPQAEATGDTAAAGTFEYRFHLARSLPIQRDPMRLPGGNRKFRWAPQQVYGRADWDLIFRGFVDAGYTVRNKPDRGVNEIDKTLLGAGAGVELRVGQNVTARVDYGVALKTTKRGNDAGKNPVSTKKGNDEVYFLFTILY